MPEPTRPARLLIVDDHEAARTSLALLLRLDGFEVRTAANALVALELAVAQPPDAMLVDIGLPHMDGRELARRVRADPALRAIRLLGVSGRGSEEDRALALAAGFDHYLVKPASEEQLLAALAGLP